MTFLTDSTPLARALAERNYTEPTPVQTAVLAEAAVGRDLLVSAQTGSGKTVAYGLAIAKNILNGADRLEKSAKPHALIVAPTRELALQVQRELAWLYQYAGGRIVSCVGGMDPRREQRELADGAHIVVGTPGRLCDHLRRGRLDVSELKAVVLDEADEMLNLGFREELEFILKTTPDERRTLLFSATLPRIIVSLAKQYQKNAWRVEVTGGDAGHADIEYRAIRVAPNDAEHAVVNVLRFFESPSTLVFCNTRNAVRHLQAALLERGFSVVALSGELTQGERMNALQALRDGRARVCVATDVAARGIDLPNLSLVIHAELPNDPEVMQHRSGRTGRAGKKGVSVLLVPPSRRRRVEMMFSQAGVNAIWGATPQAEEIRKLDQQRMMQDVLFTEAPTEEDLVLARALLAERSGEEIAAALARLYRAKLPSPEDILDPGQSHEQTRDYSNARSRDDRGPRPARGDEGGGPGPGKRTGFRRSMEGGSVWFSASVGSRKNAEARWLLPMICRRGGISKSDIGAIKIYDTITEFEISGKAAESFAAKVQDPDKDENIRIATLPNGPQGQPASENSAVPPARDANANDGKAIDAKPSYDKSSGDKPFNKSRPHGKPRYEKGPKRHGGPAGEQKFDKKPGFNKKQRYEHKPGYVGQQRSEGAAPFAKPAFGKKPKKKKNRGQGGV